MIRHLRLEPRFVKGVPRELEPGVLYVSMEYGTVVHSCCCGCGQEVVTPLTPTDWKLTFDGESISLHPSVGNWNLPCRSHYVVRNNRVIEAGSWDQARIKAEVSRDKAAKAAYYAQPAELPKPRPAISTDTAPATTKAGHVDKGLWAKLRRWFC
jgi:hypothetical protein